MKSGERHFSRTAADELAGFAKKKSRKRREAGSALEHSKGALVVRLKTCNRQWGLLIDPKRGEIDGKEA